MDSAPIILSTLALIEANICLIWLISKHFSTHVIQYVDSAEALKGKKGANIFDQFAEIGAKGVAVDIGDDQ